MSIKQTIFCLGLSVLLAGCSTGMSVSVTPGAGTNKTNKNDNNSVTVGMKYLLGRGVEQNDERAFFYLKQAASAGDAFAENEVAYMYAAGKGTKRDYSKALRYYEKAANHGLISAQYNLGLMYMYGMGTEPNQAIAKTWIEKSAAGGFEPAKQLLAEQKV